MAPLRTRSCGRSWMPLRRSISAHSYGSRATPETSTMSGAMNWQSLRAGEQVVSGPTSGRPRLAKMTKLHRMIVQKAPRPLRRWRITSEQRIKRLSEWRLPAVLRVLCRRLRAVYLCKGIYGIPEGCSRTEGMRREYGVDSKSQSV